MDVDATQMALWILPILINRGEDAWAPWSSGDSPGPREEGSPDTEGDPETGPSWGVAALAFLLGVLSTPGPLTPSLLPAGAQPGPGHPASQPVPALCNS